MRKACQLLGVVPMTLRRWEKAGKIKCIRTPSGQRRFPRSEILRLLGERAGQQSQAPIPPGSPSIAAGAAPVRPGDRAAVYARVSCLRRDGGGSLQQQKAGLQRYAQERGYRVMATVADRGSGFSEKRRGLLQILDMARQGQIDVVLVASKDRLALVGFSYIERYLGAFGVRVEITGGGEIPSLREELREDMLGILTGLGARLCGKGGQGLRRRAREAVAYVAGECGTLGGSDVGDQGQS